MLLAFAVHRDEAVEIEEHREGVRVVRLPVAVLHRKDEVPRHPKVFSVARVHYKVTPLVRLARSVLESLQLEALSPRPVIVIVVVVSVLAREGGEGGGGGTLSDARTTTHEASEERMNCALSLSQRSRYNKRTPLPHSLRALYYSSAASLRSVRTHSSLGTHDWLRTIAAW